MPVKTWMIALVVLFMSAARVMPQDQAAWTLVSAQPLRDVVGHDYNPFSSVLSPDGSAVAWWDSNVKQICVYIFAEAQTTCYEHRDEMPKWGNYSFPTWSPDGRFIAYTESFFDMLRDSDIWVLDTQTGQITDKTDDQVYTDVLHQDKAHPAPIDYLPTWNPASADLYFFRSTRTADTWSTALYRLPAAQGQPELVVVLSALPVLSISSRVSISPDGTSMAVTVLGRERQDEKNGIYLIDLKSGDLKKVATVSDLSAGLPEWANAKSQMVPDMIFWAHQDKLVVSMSSTKIETHLTKNTIAIDLTSGAITPLLDFSKVADDEEFAKGPDSPALHMIQIGVPSPDGNSFWALRSDETFSNASIAARPLPPTSQDASPLGDVPDFKVMSSGHHEAFVSSDGKALMFGWLFTFSQTPAKP